MNPEQIRLQALMLADKRKDASAPIEEVIAEAEKVLKFLLAGIKVAE